MKTRYGIIAAIMAMMMLLSFAACAVKPEEKKDDVSAATEVPKDEPTAAPTDEPTEEPTKEPELEPTEEPEPTKEPKKGPESIDPGTDYYFDFTQYGGDEVAPDPLGAIAFEEYEDGVMMYAVAPDPYCWIIPSEPVPASEYKYVAFKVKATKNDKQGQLRFATTTDDRGWALVNYQYSTPGEWEIIVLDISKAMHLVANTMEGDIVRLRIDPYDDEGASEALSEDYQLVLESMALFDDPEKAKAFAGLYKWEETAE